MRSAILKQVVKKQQYGSHYDKIPSILKALFFIFVKISISNDSEVQAVFNKLLIYNNNKF